MWSCEALKNILAIQQQQQRDSSSRGRGGAWEPEGSRCCYRYSRPRTLPLGSFVVWMNGSQFYFRLNYKCLLFDWGRTNGSGTARATCILPRAQECRHCTRHQIPNSCHYPNRADNVLKHPPQLSGVCYTNTHMQRVNVSQLHHRPHAPGSWPSYCVGEIRDSNRVFLLRWRVCVAPAERDATSESTKHQFL